MNTKDRVVAIKRAAQAKLLGLPGVHAVGVGVKIIDGKRTNELAVRVYVTTKRPLGELPDDERIPASIEGVRTDVIEAPPATTSAVDNASYRPIIGGSKVSVKPPKFGTLGCLAKTTDDPPEVVGLTNHHVLLTSGAGLGDNVGQPTPESCGNCCSTGIGITLRDVLSEDVDGAIIALEPGMQWKAEIVDIDDPVKGIAEALEGDEVRKRGCTTQLTRGFVDDIDFSGTRDSDGWVFKEQLLIRPLFGRAFSEGGDSGAVVLSEDGNVVALLWGGATDSSYSCATPISKVQSQLEITICTATQRGVIETIPGAEGPEAGVAPLSGGGVVHTFAETGSAGIIEPFRLQSISHVRLNTLKQQGINVDGLLRHAEEVRTLILTNPRVAVAWRRAGGPEILRTFVGQPVVEGSVASKPNHWAETLGPFISLLTRYGSAALCEDLAEFSGVLDTIEGQLHGKQGQ
ncbi:MAG TPA: hypothetical protein VF756_24935 [Thermoanaerobaculia bacterium]